jgi:energy-converting hydrogenase A subunit M
MDADKIQEISERDQLWASLRGLHEEIERLAAGQLDDSERQRQLTVLLARIVAAEMSFRAKDAEAS